MPEKKVFVYLISTGENGPVKVGVTNNLRNRLSMLQTGNPCTLDLLQHIEFCDYESAIYVEKAILETFNRHYKRLRGEWFLVDHERALELFQMNIAWFDHNFNVEGLHP